MNLGFQPVSLTAQFYGNAIHPEGAPVLDNAVTDCVSVSEVKQAGREDDHGEETETIGTGGTTKEVNPKSSLIFSLCWLPILDSG